MGQGFTADMASLAIRVGELNAVADAVDVAANYLDTFSGDLGPGGIAEAVHDVAEEWHEGLDKMKDKIHDMSRWLREIVDDYEQLEWDSKNRFIAKVDNDIETAAEDALRAQGASHIPEGKI